MRPTGSKFGTDLTPIRFLLIRNSKKEKGLAVAKVEQGICQGCRHYPAQYRPAAARAAAWCAAAAAAGLSFSPEKL